MSATARHYLQLAENCGIEAAEADLDNRRETLLRSREVWLGLAARELATQTARAERDRQRNEERPDA